MCPSTGEWVKNMQDKINTHTQWYTTQHPSPCLRLSFKETQTKIYIFFFFNLIYFVGCTILAHVICHVASHIYSAVYGCTTVFIIMPPLVVSQVVNGEGNGTPL